MPSRFPRWMGATGQAELKGLTVTGEKSVMAKEFVTPRVGDGGWKERHQGRQGEVDAWLIWYSHRLKSELGRLRGRARQAEKRYV